MSSVLMADKDDIYHYEIPPLEKKVIFDEALEELDSICERIDFSEVTSLKYFVASWGMSCSKSFADKYLTQMKKL